MMEQKRRRRKRKKKASFRRKETIFRKRMQMTGAAIAFVLLMVSTVLTGMTLFKGSDTGRKVSGTASMNAGMTDEGDGSALLDGTNADEAALGAQGENGAAAVDGLPSAAQETPPEAAPIPQALPIPDYVPEQDAQAFFTNGLASPDGQSITILGAGDNLIHDPIYERAATENGYDFNFLYTNVKDFIQSADIATLNQEAPLATDLGPASGYPEFNTPKEVGQALYNAGFDVINIGNNHMYDVGSQGALVTAQYFRDRGIPTVGFYRNMDDYNRIRIVQHGGIKVAFVSFVETVNLSPDNDELGFTVKLQDEDMVRNQIQRAKEQADIVVAHAHWGEEGTTELTDLQVGMAQFMVNCGVDIIYGNHPHVIQGLTVLTRDSDGQLCPVIYSMGNFVTAQIHRNEIVSAMLAVKITRDANGIARPEAMGVLPLVTHFTQEDRKDVVIYPAAMYTDELAASHRAVFFDGEFNMGYIYGLLGNVIPDRYLNRMSSLTTPG